jgi:hypothetical protein
MTEATTKRARTIDDAGEKIGGARKDWRDRFMAVSDLDDMTGAEAVNLVKKDNIWPQPDWEAVVADGMPAEAAAYVKIMRDRIAKTPSAMRPGQDAGETRRGYVEMITVLRETMMAVRNYEDARDVYGKVLVAVGADQIKADESARRKFFTVYTGRKCPFVVSYDDGVKVRKMLAEGFPAKVPTWRKGVLAYPVSGGGYMLIKNSMPVSRQTFADEAAAWKWLTDENVVDGAKKSKKTAPMGPVAPDRPHLDRLERSGMKDHRGGADVTADDFIGTFGFRGVEFGLWLPDDERQRVLNLAYDALFDLAEVLDWDPSRISLDGTLALAFGARGSGKHAAHYEDGLKVVNLTRLKGAGTVAHEYGHAIDNWAGEVDVEGQSHSVRSATGWRSRVNDVKSMLKNLTDEQAEAWDRVVDGLFNSPMTREEVVEMLQRRLNDTLANIAKYEGILQSELEKPVERRNRKYLKDVHDYLKGQMIRKVTLEKRIPEIEKGSEEVKLGSRHSTYLENARRLCGKSGEYWIRPNEMFARAFETYVFEKLTEKGARSDYLVHGCEEDRYADAERFKGNPYPVGPERERILKEVEDVVTAMKPRVELYLSATAAPK